MSEHADNSRLEFIAEMISDIEYTLEKYTHLTQALDDRIAKHALLMCLLQIGETLNKIETPALRSRLPIKGAYDVRNFIAHDYEGVDKGLIDSILRYQIPELKEIVDGLI